MSFKISENNSRMFSSSREVDRCIFCGGHKEVKKKNSKTVNLKKS